MPRPPRPIPPPRRILSPCCARASRRSEIARSRVFVIRDPLLGDIDLTPAERDVLDSDIFQRQRGVKQLGTSMLLYPSAVQTRFVHAVGNLRIAGEMIANALDKDPELTREYLGKAKAWLVELATVEEQREELANADLDTIKKHIEQVARIAGMCHDLGHFPMGHVLEDALRDPEIVKALIRPEESGDWAEWVTLRGAAVHEYATIRLLENNGGGRFAPDASRAKPFTPGNEWLRVAVLEVIKATHVSKEAVAPHLLARSLAELVSGEIDSDRAEYLRRDSVVSGAGYGQYDAERLIDSYTLARDHDGYVFRPSSRALAAVQTFLLERVKAYGHLYYHNLGFLMDALLGAVLRALYRGPDTQALRQELSSDAERTRFDDILKRLPLARLHYDNFDDPRGYVDDATLWEFLRDVLGWVETVKFDEGQLELRRLRIYLRALLRRRRVWVSLWKYTEDFQTISEAALDAFCEAVRARYPNETRARILQAIASLLGRRIRITISPERVSVLNYIAHEFREEDRIRQFARVLEDRIRTRRPAWLSGALFVEFGERAKFKPLKAPGAYQIVGSDGTLRRLHDVAPTSVDAIMAWWFDGYPQLRMYVVTESELDDDQREELRLIAWAELPVAVREWYSSLPQQLDPGLVLAGE